MDKDYGQVRPEALAIFLKCYERYEKAHPKKNTMEEALRQGRIRYLRSALNQQKDPGMFPNKPTDYVISLSIGTSFYRPTSRVGFVSDATKARLHALQCKPYVQELTATKEEEEILDLERLWRRS